MLNKLAVAETTIWQLISSRSTAGVTITMVNAEYS
jgi:hypothetical protein